MGWKAPEEKRLLGRPRRRLEDNIKIELKGKWGGRFKTGFMWFGYGPVAGSCDHRTETSGFTKGGEFLD
jgi:hypothetical protein